MCMKKQVISQKKKNMHLVTSYVGQSFQFLQTSWKVLAGLQIKTKLIL